jgi:hypothetical protein
MIQNFPNSSHALPAAAGLAPVAVGFGPNAATFYAGVYGLRVVPGLRPSPGVGLSGLGATSQQIGSIAATGALTTVSILHALSIGLFASGPVTAVIGALISVGALVAGMFHGCGQTCVAATQDANKAADLLTQNLNAYMAAPVHYKSIQAAALNNVDTLFTALRQACSDPSLGAAGQRCISERLVRGGTAPWCPNSGHTGCDWFVQFRDPIANDPHVVPDPVAGGASSDSSVQASGAPGSISSPLVLTALGLIFVGVIL